ncbi:hypothetical protein TYRP_012770 [Tyrophagus putrescentiae]|nr:hypothetical protein TYRP_012770 [Tyrophagus putrescentiae]
MNASKVQQLCVLLCVCLCASVSVNAFVEDIWLPNTEPPLPTTTTEKPPPPPPTSPPPPPVDDRECAVLCYHVTSCKDILANYSSQSTVCREGAFDWKCFEQQQQQQQFLWPCPARFGCPGGHIRSGFGSTVDLQRRCLPLHTCRYFAHMYAHLNEVHEEVFQLC